MALITCPDCNRMVSDLAESCPNCGYPIHKYVERRRNEARMDAEKEEKEKRIADRIATKEAKKRERAENRPLAKRTKTCVSIITTVIFIALILIFIFQFKQPYEAALPAYYDAKEQYETAITGYNSKLHDFEICNEKLNKKIKEINDVINSGKPPLDNTYITAAIDCVNKAETEKKEIPSCSINLQDAHNDAYSVFSVYHMIDETSALHKDTELINSETSAISLPDYEKTLDALDIAKANLEKSYKQYEQVTNPTEAFVIERLSTVPGIIQIDVVTEDNDPNGNLNKPGGYTATVYFSHKNVTEDLSYQGNTVIDKGTDCGGAIEVYANREDAERRDSYLGVFDGGILCSGSHVICGTVVVRTSNYLTASQQRELEENLISALTELK